MKEEKIYSKLFYMPAFLLFVMLFLLPSIVGLFLSLTNWNVMSENIKFIGLDNYIKIFEDKGTWLAIKNTLFYAVTTSILKGAVGLMLAVALNREIRSKNWLRTIFFLPMVISNLIVGIVFQQIYHPTNGIVNLFLHTVGLGAFAKSWITDPTTVMWACIFTEVWKAAGFNMVIFLAGLQGVPEEMYEASRIDGATAWQQFKSITIPFIMPSIVINMLLNIISGLKVFDVIFTLTNGGPGRASEVVNITIFNQFSMGKYGYATALNSLLFLFLSLISIIIIKKYTQEEGD